MFNYFPHVYLPEYVGSVHLPAIVPYVALVGVYAFVLGILPMLIYIERVVVAFMQDRSGPNRVGPRGLLQTTADVVKLFFKEDVQPKSVDPRIYILAPIIAVIPAFASGAVLPLMQLWFFRGTHLALPGFQLLTAANQPYVWTRDPGTIFAVPLTVGNVNVGLLYILALASLQAYGVVLAGWSSNNKYSLLGGLRASAQLISYELAMGLALLCVIVMAGSLQLDRIVEAQNQWPFGISHIGRTQLPLFLKGSIFSWYWLQSLLVPVVIYTIAMIAETNRAPFDLPEAEAELIAGFMTEYSSMKYAMFFTGEYVSMLTVSGLNASMFWGGPLPPFNISFLNILPGFVWFILKVMTGIFFYVWLRGTLPRLRYDALMNLGWKRMLPAGLVWLFLLAGLVTAKEALVNDSTPPAAAASAGTVTRR
jgi:NADH-quinone oxidoreductase subunit H